MHIEKSETETLYSNIFETTSYGILITDLETDKILVANSSIAEMHGFRLNEIYGFQYKKFIHANSLACFADYSKMIKEGGEFEILAQHVRRDGSLIDVEWRSVAFKHHDRDCALAFLRDVSDRIQAEHQLEQQVIERELEQTTLLEISQTLASNLELQPGLILDQLGILIKYTHASLFTLVDSTLVALAVRGIEKLEESAPFRIRLHGKSTMEALFNGQRPIRIADVWGDEIPAKFLRSLLEDKSAVFLEGVHSWMWVPLAVKNRIIGGFGIADSERNYFTLHDADLAMTIANQAAMSMANAELYEHAQTLAAMQERQRLAQNLHDAVNQSLFSAGLIAEVLPRLWVKDPVEGQRSLEDLRHLINGAMAEMRALLAELRPKTLTDTELGELLILLGNAFTGRTNIPVDIEINGEKNLEAQTQVAIYRICQEALNNIAKHAKAHKVKIELNHTAKELRLNIQDDGCGFDISKLKSSSHYGMTMMRERSEAVGGTFTVSSHPGQGTKIEVRWRKKEY